MTYLTDSRQREEQYIQSILFYLRSPGLAAIIVCDNSGFDYSENASLRDAVSTSGKEVEFLHFSAPDEGIREKGKGYGEGLLMAYVLRESKLLQRSADSFFKVTGRLTVLNLDTIAQKVRPGETYFDAVGLNPFKNRKKVDTRFYYCNKTVFEAVLMNAFGAVDDLQGCYLEHVYYRALKEHGIGFRRFVPPPVFDGISGSTGLPYSTGAFKRLIKKILRYLSFWR